MDRDPIGKPHIATVSEDGRVLGVRKIPRKTLKQGYSEDLLQELIHTTPEILPAGQVDSRVQEPLASLAREVSTPSGPIDNLMISPNGYPVIVETKLWRNPEARRKVVAQLLDYAAQVRGWSYEDLESVWKKKSSYAGSLWSFVQPPDLDVEADWVDVVSENLRLGRFLLLIVGDGIRAAAQQLGAVLNGYPDFQFRLGLVELRLYPTSETEIMILPSCIAKTTEIERAVVRIEESQGIARVVSVETPTLRTKPRGVTKNGDVLDEQAVLDALRRLSNAGEHKARVAGKILELAQDTELEMIWQASAVSLKCQDPIAPGSLLSIGYISTYGYCGCWISVFAKQLQRIFEDSKRVDAILESHLSRARDLGIAGKNDVQIQLDQLSGKEGQFVAWLEGTVEMLLRLAAEEEQEGVGH